LRRTRVGPYRVSDAHTVDHLAERLAVVSLDDAAAAAFPRNDLDAEQAVRLAHGQRLAVRADTGGRCAAFAPDGAVVALVDVVNGTARPVVVFAAP
jgi:tRNA pseudouridine55 synthase